jgi:cytidyltransferase-like protein
MSRVLVAGSFDDLRSRHVRFLQEAAKMGRLHVLLWSDKVARALDGAAPEFSQAERKYLVGAIRYVDRVTLIDDLVARDTLPLQDAAGAACWAVDEASASPAKESFCRELGLRLRVIGSRQLQGFPDAAELDDHYCPSHRKQVIVTGCYDWFHSGHVRFFEEVAELGDLHVVVGHDANIRLLKGEGHPLHGQDERRYMVGSIRYVKHAYISSGDGWLDAEPEIKRIKPDIYAVNEDGDRPEKREYCLAHGIEYRVLQRRPKNGLPLRTSTDLRGF